MINPKWFLNDPYKALWLINIPFSPRPTPLPIGNAEDGRRFILRQPNSATASAGRNRHMPLGPVDFKKTSLGVADPQIAGTDRRQTARLARRLRPALANAVPPAA